MSRPPNEQGTPCAGCTACGAHAWAIILDQFPPVHTKITHFVCVACGGGMEVDINIADMRDRSRWTELDAQGGDMLLNPEGSSNGAYEIQRSL